MNSWLGYRLDISWEETTRAGLLLIVLFDRTAVKANRTVQEGFRQEPIVGQPASPSRERHQRNAKNLLPTCVLRVKPKYLHRSSGLARDRCRCALPYGTSKTGYPYRTITRRGSKPYRRCYFSGLGTADSARYGAKNEDKISICDPKKL